MITFEYTKPTSVQQNLQQGELSPKIPRIVSISQVVTEPELVQKSNELEQALENGDFIGELYLFLFSFYFFELCFFLEYCKSKADKTMDQHKRYIWYFLKANFEQCPRAELLSLLGYKIEDVNSRLNDHIRSNLKNEVDNLNDQFSNVSMYNVFFFTSLFSFGTVVLT